MSALVPDDRPAIEPPVLAGVWLTINGTEHELTIDTRTSLLDLLREQLGPDRRQEGLRPRPVRRLHGADRRARA